MSSEQDYYVKIGRELANKVRELAKREKRTIKGECELLIELGLEKLNEMEEARS